jgi:hypothetical protein
MNLGTALLLATFASIGTSLWHLLRTRTLTSAASEFDGLGIPLLFSTKVQVAHC